MTDKNPLDKSLGGDSISEVTQAREDFHIACERIINHVWQHWDDPEELANVKKYPDFYFQLYGFNYLNVPSYQTKLVIMIDRGDEINFKYRESLVVSNKGNSTEPTTRRKPRKFKQKYKYNDSATGYALVNGRLATEVFRPNISLIKKDINKSILKLKYEDGKLYPVVQRFKFITEENTDTTNSKEHDLIQHKHSQSGDIVCRRIYKDDKQKEDDKSAFKDTVYRTPISSHLENKLLLNYSFKDNLEGLWEIKETKEIKEKKIGFTIVIKDCNQLTFTGTVTGDWSRSNYIELKAKIEQNKENATEEVVFTAKTEENGFITLRCPLIDYLSLYSPKHSRTNGWKFQNTNELPGVFIIPIPPKPQGIPQGHIDYPEQELEKIMEYVQQVKKKEELGLGKLGQLEHFFVHNTGIEGKDTERQARSYTGNDQLTKNDLGKFSEQYKAVNEMPQEKRIELKSILGKMVIRKASKNFKDLLKQIEEEIYNTNNISKQHKEQIGITLQKIDDRLDILSEELKIIAKVEKNNSEAKVTAKVKIENLKENTEKLYSILKESKKNITALQNYPNINKSDNTSETTNDLLDKIDTLLTETKMHTKISSRKREWLVTVLDTALQGKLHNIHTSQNEKFRVQALQDFMEMARNQPFTTG